MKDSNINKKLHVALSLMARYSKSIFAYLSIYEYAIKDNAKYIRPIVDEI
jgi:hypothetical protein